MQWVTWTSCLSFLGDMIPEITTTGKCNGIFDLLAFSNSHLMINYLFPGDFLTLRDLLKTAIQNTFDKDFQGEHWRIFIQGVDPPLETPLQWLSEHLSHPDNFLHICMLPN